MTITPTNAEGIARARAQLGTRSAKRTFVARSAQQLACALRRCDDLERSADPGDEQASFAAATARAHVENLCLHADLYTHLEAAAIIDDGAA